MPLQIMEIDAEKEFNTAILDALSKIRETPNLIIEIHSKNPIADFSEQISRMLKDKSRKDESFHVRPCKEESSGTKILIIPASIFGPGYSC